MRTSVGMLLAIVVIIFGVFAVLNTAAEQTRDAAVVNGTNDSAMAWNLTTNVTRGLGYTYSSIAVYGGIAAVLMIALSVLVTAGRSTR